MEDLSDAGTTAVRAKFFGSSRIEIDGVRIDPRLSADTFKLFAMLLVQCPGELTRDEVAFALWPEAGESDARAALRRNIYLLRQALPDLGRALRCEQRIICWDDPRGQVFVDVARFERNSSYPNVDPVASVLDLYDGDFLPQHDGEWVEARREQLRSKATALFVTALNATDKEIANHQRVRFAERLLDLEPYREDVLRELLYLRCRMRDRAGAVATYRAFEARLREELGIAPMDETTRLYECIVRGELSLIEADRRSRAIAILM